MEDIMKNIFYASVDSVKPSELISKKKLISVADENGLEYLKIKSEGDGKSRKYPLDGKKIHLVGFGKGVLAITEELESVLDGKLDSGILSVPIDAQKFQKLKENSKIEVIEGAAGNLPDEKSLQAAHKIKSEVSSLTNDDILIVLITGGGSALLPLPIEPITLEEKTSLIKSLSRAGATINELNTVRIAISQVKGGKLLETSKNAHQIISLIISDIVNDPLHLIASGPTVPPEKPKMSAREILEKYASLCMLPDTISRVIQRNEENQEIPPFIVHSDVFLIGNNRIAIDAAMNAARSLGLFPVFLSSEVQGNVVNVSQAFFDLAMAVKSYSESFEIIKNNTGLENVSDGTDGPSEIYKSHDIFVNDSKMPNDTTTAKPNITKPIKNSSYFSRDEFVQQVEKISITLSAQSNFTNDLVAALEAKSSMGICIISGGETTVTVSGDGLGGRNQELALRFTQLCHNASTSTLSLDDLLLLSAGTDGFDGNNDAAGALGGSKILSKLIEKETKANISHIMHDFINRNDSYSFYKNFLNGYAGDRYQIITGHTGTNVMDIHVLVIMANGGNKDRDKNKN